MPKKSQLHLFLGGAGSSPDDPELAGQVPRSPISQDASLAIFKEQRKYGLQQSEREAGVSVKQQRLSAEPLPAEAYKSERPKSMFMSMKSKLRQRQKSETKKVDGEKSKSKPTISSSSGQGFSGESGGVTKSHSTSAINSLSVTTPVETMPKNTKLPRSKTVETNNTNSAAGRFLRLFSLGSLSKSKSVELEPESDTEQDVFIPQGHSIGHAGVRAGMQSHHSLSSDHCSQFCPDCGGYISDSDAMLHMNASDHRSQIASLGPAQFNSLGRNPKNRYVMDQFAMSVQPSVMATEPPRPASALGVMVQTAPNDESYRFLMRGGDSAIRYRRDKASAVATRSSRTTAETTERRKSRSLEDLLNPGGLEQANVDDFTSLCSDDDRAKTPTPAGPEILNDVTGRRNVQQTNAIGATDGPSAFKPPAAKSPAIIHHQPTTAVSSTVVNPTYDSVRGLSQPYSWLSSDQSPSVAASNGSRNALVTAEDYMVHTLDVIREAEWLSGKEKNKQIKGSQPSMEDYVSNNKSSTAGKERGSGLRVTDPNDMKQERVDSAASNRNDSLSRRATPRRHTVTMGGAKLPGYETYPEEDGVAHHAIGSSQHHSHAVMQRPDLQRSVEQQVYQQHQHQHQQQRRKTTQVVMGTHERPSSVTSHPLPVPSATQPIPGQQNLSLSAHHSQISDDDSFRRGGRLRASLPVVRTPNMSLDQPLGTVFLVFRNETKRALLPNEITTVDTVRALFVRAFSDYLSLPWFDVPGHKIYIKEPTTDVYYELDNLREIVDKTVLKVVETENLAGTVSPRIQDRLLPGYESDTSSRSAPVRSPATLHRPSNTYDLKQNGGKSHSYSVYDTMHGSHIYDQGPIYAQRPHSHYGVPQRNSLSPQHAVLLQRHSATYADPHQCTNNYGYHDYQDPGAFRSGSITPTIPGDETRERMERMESHLAHLTAWVQSTVIHTGSGTNRPGSAQSTSSLHSEPVSQKSRSDNNLSPIPDCASPKGMSDLSSATPKATGSLISDNLLSVQQRAHELKLELMRLRRIQISNSALMRDTISDISQKVKLAMLPVYGSAKFPFRSQQLETNLLFDTYHMDSRKVDRDLSDLESSVEDLRKDVLNRKCRVNMSEVESFALALSAISKTLADLKGKFPTLRDLLKSTANGETDLINREERFINDEPSRLDSALKRCKKLTTTLYTLKRLASVQEQRPVNVPHFQAKEPNADDHQALLENIAAIIPDHEARLQGVEAADAARERKKKLLTHSEALKFEKTLELAQQQLKATKPDCSDIVDNQASVDSVLPPGPPPKKPPRTALGDLSPSNSRAASECDGSTRTSQNYDISHSSRNRVDMTSARQSFFSVLSNSDLVNTEDGNKTVLETACSPSSATNPIMLSHNEQSSDLVVPVDRLLSAAISNNSSAASGDAEHHKQVSSTEIVNVQSESKELKLPALHMAPKESRLTQMPRPGHSAHVSTVSLGEQVSPTVDNNNQANKTTAPKVVHIKPQQDIAAIIKQQQPVTSSSTPVLQSVDTAPITSHAVPSHSKFDTNGGSQRVSWGQNLTSLALLDEDYDSDSDSTASVESQQSTIRRQLPDCNDGQLLHSGDSDSNKIADGQIKRNERIENENKKPTKRIPPPPPVRKASALSSTHTVNLLNGPATDKQKRHETEIY